MSELDTASYVHVVARVYYTGFYVTSDSQFIRLGANANYDQKTLSQKTAKRYSMKCSGMSTAV